MSGWYDDYIILACVYSLAFVAFLVSVRSKIKHLENNRGVVPEMTSKISVKDLTLASTAYNRMRSLKNILKDINEGSEYYVTSGGASQTALYYNNHSGINFYIKGASLRRAVQEEITSLEAQLNSLGFEVIE